MSEKDLIAVFLYRSDTGSDPLYGEQRSHGTYDIGKIIGVATRPKGDKICTGGTRYKDDFIDELEKKAIRWEWLEPELET